jgi:hypothetical protein
MSDVAYDGSLWGDVFELRCAAGRAGCLMKGVTVRRLTTVILQSCLVSRWCLQFHDCFPYTLRRAVNVLSQRLRAGERGGEI